MADGGHGLRMGFSASNTHVQYTDALKRVRGTHRHGTSTTNTAQENTHSGALAHTQAQTYRHTQAHTCRHTHIVARSHTHKHAHADARTQWRARTHSHTRTHADTHRVTHARAQGADERTHTEEGHARTWFTRTTSMRAKRSSGGSAQRNTTPSCTPHKRHTHTWHAHSLITHT